MILKVRENRKNNFKCESAQAGIQINEVLKRIKDSNMFKKDFETVTKNMLAFDENVSYDDAITVLDKIIELNIF